MKKVKGVLPTVQDTHTPWYLLFHFPYFARVSIVLLPPDPGLSFIPSLLSHFLPSSHNPLFLLHTFCFL